MGATEEGGQDGPMAPRTVPNVGPRETPLEMSILVPVWPPSQAEAEPSWISLQGSQNMEAVRSSKPRLYLWLWETTPRFSLCETQPALHYNLFSHFPQTSLTAFACAWVCQADTLQRAQVCQGGALDHAQVCQVMHCIMHRCVRLTHCTVHRRVR